ncbi:MAG: ammonium transporter [Verrucomicrobiae bacterium]|nr:ammonium transporter [Verrucomicrobiae bacterium]
MKKIFLLLSLMTWMALGGGTALRAADAAPAPERSLAERIADLEAYMNNVARVENTNAPSKIPGPGPGHNAWQMTSTALVLFMTLPGLALFYGGLVRRKNVLSVMAQCLGIAGLSTVLWFICGYSLTFAPGNPFIGGFDYLFLKGVNGGEVGQGSNWISNNVWAMFQLTFAIITPALIVGAIAERMKFSALMLFMLGWMFLVYFPLAHMVWAADGLMCGPLNPNAKIKALDFAGGTVVHMSSGWSALVLCLILGKRLGFPKELMPPHSMVLTMIGTGMLWVGWYGFNAGSALAADGIAANAFVATTLAAAIASFVWPMAEWVFRGKPSVLGFCSGAVAGLVVVTPACGFVNTNGAVLIGVAAGLVPFFACWKLKAWLGYDDALDTFGVHGVGGTLGAFLTGLLAKLEANANLGNNLKSLVGHSLWIEQLKAIGLTILMAVIGTTIIAFIVKAVVGLRPAPEDERLGLDITDHGEEGYNLI